VHAAIAAAGAALKASGRVGIRDAADFPEAAALLHAIRDAIADAVPRSVMFEGRRYWPRVRLAAQIDVFASPGDGEPLLIGASLSADEHGHRPGH
jgi:hypothetical protein